MTTLQTHGELPNPLALEIAVSD